MLLSYNWLKELIPNLTLTPQQVADLLVQHSYETIIKKEFSLSPLVKVVRIEKIEPHPNADHLRLATITDGQEVIQVVCGAPNIAEGQVVPFSPPGTKVLDKEGQLFELTVAKIRGIESPGMLSSKRELGLGEDHDGIYVLPADTPLGSKLADHIPNDTILEADITPNRAHDCLSHVGVAREIAALTGLKVKEPQIAEIPWEKMGDINIEITDPTLCPRYMTIAVEGIQNSSAPLWMQARLLMLEQNPHNALVDITNYIMFEIGNPTHAFDSKKLSGHNMGVRPAKEGEVIKLLDESEQKLSSDILVVTNNEEPVAIAGVKGGAASQITSETNSSLLEIANFHPFSIQKTALALNLRTEAAARFLKGIDPNLVEVAAGRLIYLVGEITGGKVSGVADNYPQSLKPWTITFRPQRASQIAGVEISNTKAKELLVSIGFMVEETASNTWEVTPPTIRLDVVGEHDVVEEVIRLYGLANIPASKNDNETAEPLTHELFVRDVVKRELVSLGFTETYNYSFEPEKAARILDIPLENHVQLKNPIAPEQAQLRTSLLPGLLANFIKNKAEFQRKNIATERCLFEIGHVYKTGNGGRVPGVVETEYLAGISLLPIEPVLEKIATLLNVPNIEVITSGALSQSVTKAAKYRLPLYAFEIDLERLIATVEPVSHPAPKLEEILASPSPVQYEELNRYPSVYRDLSILVDPSEAVEKVKEIIERAGGELLVDADLFDEYDPGEDSQAKKGTKKSLAFHLEYRAADRTLTDEEVNTVHRKIEKALQGELQSEIR